MGFRITTNGLFRNYRSNLNRTASNLNTAMKKVETHRQFTKYAEDPATASRAFQSRRAMWRAENQITNSNYLIAKFQTAWDAVDSICDGTNENPGLNGIVESIALIHDPIGSGRKPLGQSMLQTADAISYAMNCQYGDTFVFGGNDAMTTPFSWEGDKLLYRGIDVSNPNIVTDKNGVMTLKEEKTQADFQKDGADDVDAFKAYQQEYEDAKKLMSMSRYSGTYAEATYVDLGLGMREIDGKFQTSSAYDSALCGLDFLGFGVDEDGESMNVAVVLRKLGRMANNCDADSGSYDPDPDKAAELKEQAIVLAGRLSDRVSRVSERHVELDGRSKFLEENLTQLKSTSETLNEQIVEMEDIDPADAITEMMYALYCYNAALKIGTDILSQSLIDYMR